MNEDLFIANLAAATLTGKKASSLLCLKERGGRLSDEKLAELESFGVLHLDLTNRLSCPLLLLYRKDMLARILENSEVKALLSSYGYRVFTVDAVLKRLSDRYRQEICPDEIGIFLSYPVKDVVAYIDNRGRNYRYSGYWKVYDDEENARRLESCFRCARSLMVEELEKGKSLSEILSA